MEPVGSSTYRAKLLESVASLWQGMTGNKTNSVRTRSGQELWRTTRKKLIRDFNDSTTVHGVRYAFGEDISLKRRMFWLMLFLTSACLVTVDVVERIQHYLSYPVSLNLQVVYPDRMEFPAITICNQNSFRRTLSMKNGHYDILKALYESEGSLEKRDRLLEAWRNETMENLFVSNSHRAVDLIVSCKWKGKSCRWSDFTPVLTKHGQCFTFMGNASASDGLIVHAPGADNGLELVLNAEDYDNMVGPHSSSGVKVVLHQKAEVPMPEYGNELPTGRHGYIDVRVSKARNIPPPHGKCVSRSLMYMDMYAYTVAACNMECEMEFMSKTCQCRPLYMTSGMNTLPPCNIEQYRKCVTEAKVTYRRQRDVCVCPVPCVQTWYQPTLSYGSLSRFSASQIRSLQNRDLKDRFKYAREKAFMEEMDFSILFRLYTKLQTDSLPTFFRVLQDLEHIDSILSQSGNEIKAFLDGINSAIYYLDRKHKVYKKFDEFSQLLKGSLFGFKIMELSSYLYGQISLMASTDKMDQRNVYFNMMDAKVRLELKMADEILGYKHFLQWLPKQYPDIWFIDDGDLQTNPTPIVYQIPVNTTFTQISTAVRKAKIHVKKYIAFAKELLDNSTIDFKKLQKLNDTIMKYSKQFEVHRTDMNVFYNESIVGDLKHLSYVLEQRAIPLKSVILTFDKKCTSMYITTAIRSASMYLNMSVDFLTQYFNTNQKIQKVVKHFDTNEMKYFVEEVRAFASGTLHNNVFSMASVDCTEMLMDAYRAMLTVYKDIEPALGRYKDRYKHENDTINLMTAGDLENMRNYMFDKTNLLDIVLVLDKIIRVLDEYKSSLKMDQQFYRDNFLHVNVMFHELRYEEVSQQVEYTVFALMGDIMTGVTCGAGYAHSFGTPDLTFGFCEGDIGGAMGLCIGASALSVFEILDFITVLIMTKKKQSKPPWHRIHVKPRAEPDQVKPSSESDDVKHRSGSNKNNFDADQARLKSVTWIN